MILLSACASIRGAETPSLDSEQSPGAADSGPAVSDAASPAELDDDEAETPAEPALDGGSEASDASSTPMPTERNDAGQVPSDPVQLDGNIPELDAGHEPKPELDAGHEPKPELDAGNDLKPELDAGNEPELDAGHEPEQDAGHEPEQDAGHEPEQDAGHEPEQDAGHGSTLPLIACGAGVTSQVATPSGLTVKYRAGDVLVADTQLLPQFDIVNSSDVDVPLSELTLRYWLIRDGGSLVLTCDYAVLTCAQIRTSVGSACGRGADSYLEVGFLGGTLQKGTSTSHIQMRANLSDWANLDESNDYSFSATHTNYADHTRVALYRKGVLVWGVEPF